MNVMERAALFLAEATSGASDIDLLSRAKRVSDFSIARCILDVSFLPLDHKAKIII